MLVCYRIRCCSGPPGKLIELIVEAQQMRERLAENVAVRHLAKLD